MFVTGVGDAAGRHLSGNEGAIQFRAEPFPKFTVVSQGPPDSGDGRVEFNSFFDDVRHMQLFGCLLS